MKSPIKTMAGKKPRWESPDEEWLRREYCQRPDGYGKSAAQIAREVGAGRHKVEEWLRLFGMVEPRYERMSARLTGSGNYAWKGGHSQNYQKKILVESHPPECEWCLATPDDPASQLQINHIDHDRSNSEPENHMWLCHNCNFLEAHLWSLMKKGFAVADYADSELTVTFLKEANSEAS